MEKISPKIVDESKKNCEFKVLEISDFDLIGCKFNGHNLHNYLRERNIDAKQLVRKKLSNDINTFQMKSFADILNNDLIFDADIIHLHLIQNTDFDINMLYVLSKLKPIVITLHDCFYLGGHCLHSFGCEKWKVHCKDCGQLNIPMPISVDKTALNFFTKKEIIQNSNIAAITASDFIFDKVNQSPIWKNKTVYKLPFGINQDIFKPSDKKAAKKLLGIDEKSFVIMFRATKNPFKGIDIILEALNNLNTNKNITIITVEEKGLVKKFKNKYKIKEFGWVKDDTKMARLYQAADLFLMPSTQEAFGLMAVEAMSCKVPVLTTPKTAVEKVINAPVSGFCADVDKFSDILNDIVNDKTNLQQIAENAYDYAKANYGLNKYLDGMIKIYKEEIKKHTISEEAKLTISQIQKYTDYDKLKCEELAKFGKFFSKVRYGNRIELKIFGIKIKYKGKR